MFDTGGNWKLRVDLDRKFTFSDIVETILQPDIVLLSIQVKTIVA